MAFRRDRSIRDVYEERFLSERTGLYPRGGGGDRRPSYGRSDEDYSKVYDYESRFFPNGGPRNFHGEDQRGFHNEPRGAMGNRREDFSYFRGPLDDSAHSRHSDLRGSSRAVAPPIARGQSSYGSSRTSSSLGSEQGDDPVIQNISNLDRGEDREVFLRKAPFPSVVRDRSPARRDVPPSPHSRSGSSISSRGYSPDRNKNPSYPPPQGKQRERAVLQSASRDGSPHSSVSATKEEIPVMETPLEDLPVLGDETSAVMEGLNDRRSEAIAVKAQEIEKVYRQDCETFGMVVKMLVAKDPSLEKHLQNPLKENLSEIRERCLEDLRHFISELDDVLQPARQTEPSV